MNNNHIIFTFSRLGQLFRQISNADLSEEMKFLFKQVEIHNAWFDEESIKNAMEQWGDSLTEEKLTEWIAAYPKIKEAKKVGVIAAGNIPLVGFHDFLTVLISGHKLMYKASRKDSILIRWIVSKLTEWEPELSDSIYLVEDFRTYKPEAIIATGSDNTSRYFEQYFSHIPHVFRKNRTSIAVLNGEETEEEVQNLADDIFKYYGLGCRSVSKLFIPENYDIQLLFKAIYKYKNSINHFKYANNFDYYKTIYLLNQIDFLENGFAIVTENKEELSSPISVLYTHTYKDLKEVDSFVEIHSEKIQCISSNFYKNAIPLGVGQIPYLMDYADNVDTFQFLTSI